MVLRLSNDSITAPVSQNKKANKAKAKAKQKFEHKHKQQP